MKKVFVILVLLMVPFWLSAISEDDVKAMMVTLNDQLQAAGAEFRVVEMDFITERDYVGRYVYFEDRYLQLGSDWVPFDPRRSGTSEITWLSDLTEGTANGVTFEQTQTALANAMDTWNNVDCATIPLVQVPDFGIDWGYIQYLTGYGGIEGWYADITQAGWLPGSFFELIGGPGGADYIIGVTYTFIWIYTSTGEPTDIDNNGKTDVAFKESYYNDNFLWGINTGSPIDVETIVLHETGHSLSIGHFGTLFKTDANGKFHFAPRALMNAGYTGVQQEVTAVDEAAFCSIWASWPNN